MSSKFDSSRLIKVILSLQSLILNTLDYDKVISKIANTLLFDAGFINLGYRIIVLTLVDENQRTLNRISLSKTEEAQKTQEVSVVPFHKIEIPLRSEGNILIKAIKNKKSYHTNYWPDLFRPILKDKDAIANQNAAGIKTSLVMPILVRNKSIGALIFSMIKDYSEVSKQELILIKAFTDIVSLAVQNSKLYSSTKTLASKLKVANSHLKELDKMKDEFISIASHELKTPLSIAKNNLWMYQNTAKKEIDEKNKRFLTETESSLTRLQSIINELLDISRIQQGRMMFDISPNNIYELTIEVTKSFEKLAHKNHIDLILPEKIKVEADVDPVKYKEVVENLISNAVKYSGSGSVRISIEKDNKNFKVSVTDSGPGIDKKDYSKIFTKFGRATQGLKLDGTGTSTGLGLYIAKSYIRAMKGKIGFTSQLGKGTTFFFTLPIKK